MDEAIKLMDFSIRSLKNMKEDKSEKKRNGKWIVERLIDLYRERSEER